MEFKVLVENENYQGFEGEHGLSIYIEFRDQKYLLDFGASDLYLKNAKKMGLDLNSCDYFVLSHGHNDHGNGLKYFQDQPLICHPDVFVRRIKKSTGQYIGLNMTKKKMAEQYDLITSKEPYFIEEDVCFLGEIPKQLTESKYFIEDNGDDLFTDDSALVFNTAKGLIIFAGCSHSGVKNIVEYAKKVMEEDHVLMLVGGYHLKTVDEATKALLPTFQAIDYLVTGHCTAAEVIDYLQTQGLNVRKLYPSFTLSIEV
jgi:7,8-dihydropterin-6-yl-methyl-4-(beta-D-ribofuranosyl)aminobenzene 5'-phosphate synthase